MADPESGMGPGPAAAAAGRGGGRTSAGGAAARQRPAAAAAATPAARAGLLARFTGMLDAGRPSSGGGGGGVAPGSAPSAAAHASAGSTGSIVDPAGGPRGGGARAAAYASHADVLGKGAAAQMAEMRFDDAGRRQVEQEERLVLQPGIVHPYNRFFRLWWWLTIAAAAVTGWLVPYMIAFLGGHDGPGSPAYAVEATLLAVFLGDMLSTFFVARYDRGVLVGDRATLVRIYLRFRFWWDLLTVLPWDWIVLAGLGWLGADTAPARFVSLLGLLKLGRMYRIDRLFVHLEFALALPLVVTRLTRIFLFGFFLVHFGACAFWFIAQQERLLGADSWLAMLEASPNGLSAKGWTVWDQYTFSVWWAMSSFFGGTAGVDLTPATPAEVIFSMVYLAVSVLLWAFILGSVALLVARADEPSARYRHRMHALERYGGDRHLPRDLVELVQGHLRLNFTTNQEADEQMLSSLPTTLRRRVLRHMYGQQLRQCWLLAGVRPKFFDALLGVARLETFMPQVDLVAEGDAVNELMFVVAGFLEAFSSSSDAEASDRASILNAVRYSRRPQDVVADMAAGRAKTAAGTGYAMLGPGDSVAEAAFFTEVPQLELVRSLTVCRVLVVPRPAYVALTQDFPLSAVAVLEALQRNAEAAVSAEFRGGAASRLLRGSLAATLPGLSYQHTSAEAVGDPAEVRASAEAAGKTSSSSWRDGAVSGAASVGGLTRRQQQVVGNLQRIRALVKHHVAQADESRTGQFLSAAARGQADRVKLLLQQGYNPNTADYDKRTALMLAAANGHKNVVEMLLAVNANVSARDNFGTSALLEAARGGHEDVMTLLQARGARLQMDPQAQAQALCGAVTRGDVAQLTHLLRAGADANAVDYDKRAALHIAAAEGNLQAARALVEVGRARVDVASRNGNTPLDVARLAGAAAVVEYLEGLVPGAEAAAARRRAEARRADAMLRAAADGDVVAVQKQLSRGCPPDVCDYDKRTGLMLAAANGHDNVVTALLAAGANPNARDKLGGSALLEAVKAGRDALVAQLVAAGAALQLSASELSSALCAMVLGDEAGLLRRYVAAGADVNAADYDRRTALHVAAAEGNLHMAKLLVEEGGANLAAADRWGATPLAEAKRVGANDVAAYLSSPATRTAAEAAATRMAERRSGSSSGRFGL